MRVQLHDERMIAILRGWCHAQQALPVWIVDYSWAPPFVRTEPDFHVEVGKHFYMRLCATLKLHDELYGMAEMLKACEMALSCMAPEDNDATAQALRTAISKNKNGAENENGG